MRTVPESFDSMLAELADAAVSITPLPDLADVRRRARQRTTRRRAFASVLALILVGGSAGTVAAVTHKEAPPSSVGALSSAAASATPSPSAISPTTEPAAASGGTGAGSKAYEPLVGLWKLQDVTQRYLIVYSDGLFGIGEAGGWSMCFGKVSPPAAGAYPLTDVACSDYGTTGLSLASNADDSMLTLSVPARGSAPAYSQPFVRAPDVTAVPIDEKNSQVLGTWVSASADKRMLVITSDGMMTWFGAGNTGAAVSGTGMMEGAFFGGLRFYVSCGDKTDPYKVCGLFQVVPVGVGKMIVYGGYGPETFIRVSAAQDLGASSSSSATPSTATSSPTTATGSASTSSTALLSVFSGQTS